MRKITGKRLGIAAVLMASAGLMAWAGQGTAATTPKLDLKAMKAHFARPSEVPAPADNPITPAKVELGRKLFFDPRLSSSGAISCASCHNPGFAWEDGLALGVGDKGGKLGRHTPTVLNLAWGGPYFWDGRAETLEAQAKGPIEAPGEMNMSHGEAVGAIKNLAGYRAAFAEAYPGEEITIDTVAKAIATFERTLVSGEAPFDRWIKGDEAAISDEAKRGFILFDTKANCSACHAGWRFSDDGFHDIGIAGDDEGRAKIAPGIEQLRYAFKTPTLRNIDQRGPYLHDGSAPTLEAVVELYDKPPVNRPSLSPMIEPLKLSANEKSDLVAFLKTLTSEDAPQPIPNLPR